MSDITFRTMILMKCLLLSFAVVLSTVEESENSSSRRFETTTVTIDETTTAESNLTENGTFASLKKFPEDGASEQNASDENIRGMLREVKTCREKFSKPSNRTIHSSMMQRKRARFGWNSNMSVFHCNISKELVDGLKDKLHQLEIFQGIIVLYPKNRSLNADRLSGPRAEMEIKNHSESFFPNGNDRTKRDMLLENNEIESNAKVPQISHIYLGRSLYPFFTEESRIIDKDHTLPPPVYTESSYEVERRDLLIGPEKVKEERPEPFHRSLQTGNEKLIRQIANDRAYHKLIVNKKIN